jgi:hypothetical protein
VAGGAGQSLDLSQGWTIRCGKDAPVTTDILRSWTDDQATRHFSGVAVYEKTFSVPQAMLKGRVTLDFGQGKPAPAPQGRNARQRALLQAPVREAAIVYVNGQRAAAVWCPPYFVDVTRLLAPGENQLRIEVANLAVNHMSRGPLPDYRALNQRFGERFQPQDMEGIQPMPSGLIGPLQLIASETPR